jgi:23S rRNA (cytidine1920-2'-O)/16S rRNA (cytidine1409-2'-O)-methyltransferase
LGGNKERLDVALASRGLAESREKAKSLIMSGEVFVDGIKYDKPGSTVSEDALIEVKSKRSKYVSRGGYKLEKALDFFGIDPEGLTVLDAGASTGGFTDCLLRRGAAKVYAADVGYGQLAWSLRTDERVVTLERTNARYITLDMLGRPVDMAVMDLSFISLRLVLPAVNTVLREDGQVVCLIKPQFEAGKEKVGKRGVVRDPSTHIDVLRQFTEELDGLGFSLLGLTFSPIKGPEGNIEYLGYLKKGRGGSVCIDIPSLVRASHEELASPGEST